MSLHPSAHLIPMCLRINLASLSSKCEEGGDSLRGLIRSLATVTLGEKLDGESIVEYGKFDFLGVFKNKDASHAIIRMYSSGLCTMDIQHIVDKCTETIYNSPYDLEFIKSQYEGKITKLLGESLVSMNSIHSPIRRGQKLWTYATTADERLIEYDFDEIIYDVKSEWQHVQIFHSAQLGNILFLNGEVMLGESDIIYTKTLCRIGELDYKDKEVFILGGGDGGILAELLKLQPKFVTMAEIDEVVLQGCKLHMRSICGSALDSYTGPRHEILVMDCLQKLQDDYESGKKYDYVINDLTEFPFDMAEKGFQYDFKSSSLITELSLKLLKDEGFMLSRGHCWSATEYRTKLEADLIKLKHKFHRIDVLVPSFQETYCLYKIWKETA